ncbi:MAG: MBL fold metallo-hydrolase [Methanomicrobiales archaeon HGW-Methanomicrobiales-4]|nr:MAG: MBL fold metallo-hydrolase [Methanomicrobiales archaeon HGW-Methanomicrobiales-4]
MEILHGVHQIPGVQGNCYLLDRDGLVLIDSGLPRSSKKILSYIRDTMHRDPRDLQYLILTHYHPDHVGNAAVLKRSTGVKIAIHEADADYLAQKKPAPSLKGIQGKILGVLMFLWPCEKVTPDLKLYGGDTICGLRCIHTPGHTPGSICLYDPEHGVLFSGDTVITRKGVVSGPPLYATYDSGLATESVKKLSELDFEYLLPGHGVPITTRAAEKVRAFYRG